MTLQTYVTLPDVSYYWREQEGFTFGQELLRLRELFNIRRYYFVRKRLKGYLPEDDTPTKSRGWKVTALKYRNIFYSWEVSQARKNACFIVY